MSPSKRWRDEHPREWRVMQKRYYGKVTSAPRSGEVWTEADLRRLVAEDRPCDTELARELGRSMEALQIARSKLTTGQIDINRVVVDTHKYGALSGMRDHAPEVVSAATVCSRCGLTHPGDC